MADENVTGQTSGAADSSTATSASPAAATPAASAQPVATTQATQAPATSGAPGDGWVPSYRVRETREAALREAETRFSAREAEFNRQLEQYQNQLRALVGVQPPQDPQLDQVKQQFGGIYPGLAKLEEKAAQLEALLERAGDIESQTNHYWQTYGRQTMDNLFKAAEASLGSPLSDEGKRALHSSFVGFVQSSPELTQRYASDPTIVEDFWKAFSTSLIDPVRRNAGAQVATRAAAVQSLPQDTPGGTPHAQGAPKPANLDERVAMGWAQYQNNARK